MWLRARATKLLGQLVDTASRVSTRKGRQGLGRSDYWRRRGVLGWGGKREWRGPGADLLFYQLLVLRNRQTDYA